MINCPYNEARVQALKAFLDLKGLSVQDISNRLGCSAQWVHYVVSGTKKMPARRREQLLDMGIPEHLLPMQDGCPVLGRGIAEQDQV